MAPGANPRAGDESEVEDTLTVAASAWAESAGEIDMVGGGLSVPPQRGQRSAESVVWVPQAGQQRVKGALRERRIGSVRFCTLNCYV
jgi:hypothetical protein